MQVESGLQKIPDGIPEGVNVGQVARALNMKGLT